MSTDTAPNSFRVEPEQEQMVLAHVRRLLMETPDLTQCIACVEALETHFREHPVTTVMEFEKTVKWFTDAFLREFHERSVESCLAQYLQRGQNAIGGEEDGAPDTGRPVCEAIRGATEAFEREAAGARRQISRLGAPLVAGVSRVLLHGRSRTALALLDAAKERGQHMVVFLTPGAFYDNSAAAVRGTLERMGIACVLVPDCSVMAAVRAVDLVLLGAVLVDEAGGILNRAGSAQVCLVAHAFHKQVIVVAETFKFSRMFVLGPSSTASSTSQRSSRVILPPGFGDTRVFSDARDVEKVLDEIHRDASSDMPVLFSEYDYTPPEHIDLIVTNAGVLSPSSVSGELIKLYGY